MRRGGFVIHSSQPSSWEEMSDDQVLLAGSAPPGARFVEAGHSCHAAACHFEVSVAFVVRLMATYRVTGSLAAKPEGGWRYSKLDPHREFLLQRVAEKGDLTMPQLAAELVARGTKVTPASIARWFIRNGYSVKKTLRASGPSTSSG